MTHQTADRQLWSDMRSTALQYCDRRQRSSVALRMVHLVLNRQDHGSGSN